MRKTKPLPSLQELNDLFTLDPLQGVLLWKVSKGNIAAGSYAGSRAGNGYVMVGLNNTKYYVHRIIFKMHYGYELDEIDHDNRNRMDNRPANLKPANQGQNGKNKPMSKRNKTGVTGVYPQDKGWTVKIGNKHVGWFKHFQDAVAARKAAEIAENYHPNHGT